MGSPISLDYPELQRFNFQGGGFLDKAFIALTLALSLYTGAFIAESVRAGIQAVSRGQTEAAGALGLRPNRIMSLVDDDTIEPPEDRVLFTDTREEQRVVHDDDIGFLRFGSCPIEETTISKRGPAHCL